MTEMSPNDLPDLTNGIRQGDLADGKMLVGRIGNEPVLLARRGTELFAIGATCTHYGGPLGEGLMVEDTVRCPWHHACFSLRTGEALAAPALNATSCWRVEQRDGRIFVSEQVWAAGARMSAISRSTGRSREHAIIIGSGAAGNAAAEMLRREGYGGGITMISADPAAPYDRPNLSKDYLAGNAPEEWVSLRPPEFYREHDIELKLGARVTAIDRAGQRLQLEDGSALAYDKLLLATGADPVRLNLPGGDLPHVHYLRSLADSRAIIAQSATARRAVVIGASFIGLEVAAALRARQLEVHVVAPETIPMERVMGAEIGGLVRTIHEQHGVHFHLGTTAVAIDPRNVTLKTGEKLEADLVVVGIGVRPSVGLAEQAGLEIDRGVVVDRYLRTSHPNIFAAGDIARWPDPHSGENIRVEHWVVAQRQGQTAARNIMGRNEPFDAVPFFWSMHYDVSILYVGHAEKWDSVEIDGSVDAKDCRATYRREGRSLAVATIGRDLESLRAEVELETSVQSSTRQKSRAEIMNPLKSLNEYGQVVWLDFLSRRFIADGSLKRLIDEDGLAGATSNPSIFEKAIVGSRDYDAELVAAGKPDDRALFERIAVEDVRNAADVLRPVYDATGHRDGYISIEVSPDLAMDTDATVEEAHRLWRSVGRRNLMIKVPATTPGLAAIRRLIGDGINVNITLLFSQIVYEGVVEAYFGGLEDLVARGGDPGKVASVASFFVSRIDTAVDKLVDARLAQTADTAERLALTSIRGKVAIANAALAYQRYKRLFAGPRWVALQAKGARTQRLLWASTGTKNPEYSDVLYVEELIGPDTINTMPLATMDAFRDHGKLRASLEEDVQGARQVMSTLDRLGISIDDVTEKILDDGVQAFAEAMDKTLNAIAAKRASAATTDAAAVHHPATA